MLHFLQDDMRFSLFLGLAGNKEGDEISTRLFSLLCNVLYKTLPRLTQVENAGREAWQNFHSKPNKQPSSRGTCNRPPKAQSESKSCSVNHALFLRLALTRSN